MTEFEKELNKLLRQADSIPPPSRMQTLSENTPAYTWMNNVDVFAQKYLKGKPLYNHIQDLLSRRSDNLAVRQGGIYGELVSCMQSVNENKEIFLKGAESFLKEYDVFLSHANDDKGEIVDELYTSLKSLGINIFYDKTAIEWGDNWKERILEGTKKAEFAIIVISTNFFDREWTEKELSEFLSRQNQNKQKIILPILHKITIEQLRNQYPTVADIQAIDSKDFSCDQIALLFARQLIYRLKHI